MDQSVTAVELPPAWCPLESAVHPRVREVERRAEDWIRDSGMCADDHERAWAVATYSTDFYARFAPGADDDRLPATALWVYWGFAFDGVVRRARGREQRPPRRAGRVLMVGRRPAVRPGVSENRRRLVLRTPFGPPGGHALPTAPGKPTALLGPGFRSPGEATTRFRSVVAPRHHVGDLVQVAPGLRSRFRQGEFP